MVVELLDIIMDVFYNLIVSIVYYVLLWSADICEEQIMEALSTYTVVSLKIFVM